ncbi:MAG: sulfatase-like hydrolase/transferase [Chloroflexota bacterium]
MKRLPILAISLIGSLVAVYWALSSLASDSPQIVSASEQPTIIFVVVDALRSDHVSSYGYGRPTTPNLDQWVGAQGVQFLDASSTSSWTYPANAAMLTGRMPSDIGVRWHDDNMRIPESETMLAEYCKRPAM